jgi:hypothetical protein
MLDEGYVSILRPGRCFPVKKHRNFFRTEQFVFLEVNMLFYYDRMLILMSTNVNRESGRYDRLEIDTKKDRNRVSYSCITFFKIRGVEGCLVVVCLWFFVFQKRFFVVGCLFLV